jgi:hypothetical protein
VREEDEEYRAFVELCCLYLVLFRCPFLQLSPKSERLLLRSERREERTEENGRSGCGRSTVAGWSTPQVTPEEDYGEGELRGKRQQGRRQVEGRKREEKNAAALMGDGGIPASSKTLTEGNV